MVESAKQKIRQGIRRMFAENDTEMMMTIIDQALDEAAKQIIFRFRTYVKTIPVDMAISIIEQELAVLVGDSSVEKEAKTEWKQ